MFKGKNEIKGKRSKMKYQVYAIFDGKAKAWLTPFFLPTDGMATRIFTDCIADKDHAFGAHPEDYTLTRIGEWDTEDGQLEPQKIVETLGNGLEFIPGAVAPEFNESLKEVK